MISFIRLYLLVILTVVVAILREKFALLLMSTTQFSGCLQTLDDPPPRLQLPRRTLVEPRSQAQSDFCLAIAVPIVEKVARAIHRIIATVGRF